MLLAGLVAPALLGPGYEAARESPAPDAAIRVVPLPAYAGLLANRQDGQVIGEY